MALEHERAHITGFGCYAARAALSLDDDIVNRFLKHDTESIVLTYLAQDLSSLLWLNPTWPSGSKHPHASWVKQIRGALLHLATDYLMLVHLHPFAYVLVQRMIPCGC